MNMHFQKEIENLKKKILTQCAFVEENLALAVASFAAQDRGKARKVIADDKVIDQREIDIEEECLKLLALYQPVAADLRYIVICLKVNNDLERIGDLSCNIAERTLNLVERAEELAWHQQLDFEEMTTKTQLMMKSTLDSLVRNDAMLALEVIGRDDEIDRLNSDFHDRITELIRRDPEHTEMYIPQLSVSKQLERIADISTNICEDVIYMVTGNIVRHTDLEHPEHFAVGKVDAKK
ncbi:MAG: phosphate signaling complex protein PhoU [Victivallales bacterium]|nr:phosphate signaling complex protein PhoU [Victivallales bacterium]